MRGRNTLSLNRFGQLAALGLALVSCGCASDWLATLRNEPLPVDEPSPYPTAVHVSDSPQAERDAASTAQEEQPAAKPLPQPLPTVRAAKTALAVAPHRIGRPPPPVPVDLTHLKTAKEQAAQQSAVPDPEAKPAASKSSSAGDKAAPEPTETSQTTQATTPPATTQNLAANLPAADLAAPAAPEAPQAPANPPSASQTPASPRSTGTEHPIQVAAIAGHEPLLPADPNQPTLLHASHTAITANASSEGTPLDPHFDVPHMSPEERLTAMAAQRDVLIAMLEEEIQLRRISATPDSELARLEQQLRLLYAAADRVDDAVRGIDALSASEREAFKHTMFGVSTWLSETDSRKSPLRNARALRSLREATTHLSAVSKLDLKSLALCERVENFGWFSEFPRYEFQPKQQVILYVEVDNFVAVEKSPNSFETELQGHYQIFDARGNIVAERKLPLDREICRNYRRDYFLAYPIYMPEHIESGKYRLELTIEDLKAEGEYQGRKFGEGMIEFTIRG
jgi:hypothetical protein